MEGDDLRQQGQHLPTGAGPKKTKAEREAAKARRAARQAEQKGDDAGSGSTDPQRARIVQKRDFIGRVADASGISRAQARPLVEATLAALGSAIAAGETLALPPFGMARIKRTTDNKGGEVIVLKLRRKADDDTPPNDTSAS
ncbi:MAG: hypothetical protein DI498_14120 [Paracoccus denitrificans]|nr:MAG: hypothetical protein DI498_14120 [Paracoccus denitrificans]PZO82830.1 MAG: hypothetical protein DI633_14120 [Paracoccus denitrificans]